MTLAGEAAAPDDLQTTVAHRRRVSLLRFFLRRAATGVLTLLVASMLIFAATDLLPGSPASNALGKFATPEDTRALNQKLGFEHPLPVRYWNWLSGAAQGDLGDSAVGTANSGTGAHLAADPRPAAELAHARDHGAILLVPLSLSSGRSRRSRPDG
jgi:peptide/nickel transport system permease protein